MQATIVDLRYHMKKVLQALARGEEVTVVYHRRKIAAIRPLREKPKNSPKSHPFMGMLKNQKGTVNNQINKLRGSRYRDI